MFGRVRILTFISAVVAVSQSAFGESPFSPPFSIMGARTQDLPTCTDSAASFVIDDGSKFYAVGMFSGFGACVGNRLSFFKTNGALSPNYDNQLHVNGEIYKVVPDGTGAYYIAGNFSKVGPYTRNCIAKINSDGSVNAWNAGVEWQLPSSYIYGACVHSIALYGSEVYFAGNFNNVKGVPRINFAVVDTAGNLVNKQLEGLDSTNGPSGIRALHISGTTMYVGGSFVKLRINGSAIKLNNFIGAVDLTNFSHKASFNSGLTPGPCTMVCWSIVAGIAVNNNKIYVAGTYYNPTIGDYRDFGSLDLNGVPSNYDPLGVTSAGLMSYAYLYTIPVNSISFYGTDVILTGSAFNTGVSMYDGTTGVLKSNFSSAINNGSTAVKSVIDGTSLYVLGNLNLKPIVGYPDNTSAVKIDLTTGLRQAWAVSQIQGVANDFDLVGATSNTLEIVGAFNVMNLQTAKWAISVNKSSLKATAVNLGIAPPSGALWLSDGFAYNGKIYISGFDTNLSNGFADTLGRVSPLIAFDSINGAPDPNFNVTATRNAGPITMSGFSRVRLDGGFIYVSGDFNAVNGVTRNGIARLNPTTGAVDLTWSSNFLPAQGIGNFVMDANYIYVVQLLANGYGDMNVVRLNKSNGNVDTSFISPTFRGMSITSMINDGSVYVSGYVDLINGLVFNGVSALNPITGAAQSGFTPIFGRYNMQYSNATQIFALNSGGSYVNIDKATGAVTPHIVDLTPAATSGSLRFFDQVYWMLVHGIPMSYEPSTKYVYAVGEFTKNSDGKFRNLVRFDSQTGAVAP